MRIENINRFNNNSNFNGLKDRVKYSRTTQFLKRTNDTLPDSIKIPLKYYLIGLAVPFPFVSALGLIYGIGVVAVKKIKNLINKNKTS